MDDEEIGSGLVESIEEAYALDLRQISEEKLEEIFNSNSTED